MQRRIPDLLHDLITGLIVLAVLLLGGRRNRDAARASDHRVSRAGQGSAPGPEPEPEPEKQRTTKLRARVHSVLVPGAFLSTAVMLLALTAWRAPATIPALTAESVDVYPGATGVYGSMDFDIVNRVTAEPGWFGCSDTVVKTEIRIRPSTGTGVQQAFTVELQEARTGGTAAVRAWYASLTDLATARLKARMDWELPVEEYPGVEWYHISLDNNRDAQDLVVELEYRAPGWMRWRALGSCSVLLPRLIAPERTPGVEAPSTAGTRRPQNPGVALNRLLTTSGVVDANESSPPPTEQYIDAWICGESQSNPVILEAAGPPDCHSRTVLEKRDVDTVEGVLIFVAAAFFSVGLDSGYQRLRATRRRPLTPEESNP